MARYLTDTLLNFESFQEDILDIEGEAILETYVLPDYRSFDILGIYEYIDSLPEETFMWYQLEDDTKLEKVALDLYGNSDYWDILMLINQKDPLFHMPYNYDTLVNSAEIKAQNYIDEIYGNTITNVAYNALVETYKKKFIKENEIFRYIRIIKPSQIYKFLQDGFEKGYFK